MNPSEMFIIPFCWDLMLGRIIKPQSSIINHFAWRRHMVSVPLFQQRKWKIGTVTATAILAYLKVASCGE